MTSETIVPPAFLVTYGERHDAFFREIRPRLEVPLSCGTVFSELIVSYWELSNTSSKRLPCSYACIRKTRPASGARPRLFRGLGSECSLSIELEPGPDSLQERKGGVGKRWGKRWALTSNRSVG